MSRDTISCDPEMISRYHDGELDSRNTEKLEQHMMACTVCREHYEVLKGLSRQIKTHVSARSETVLQMTSVENNVIRQIRELGISPWKKLRAALLAKKTLIPAAAAACLALVLFSVLQPGVPAGPSAIVTSLSGDMASVIVMETPDTGHTIVWFTESTGS